MDLRDEGMHHMYQIDIRLAHPYESLAQGCSPRQDPDAR